jgi:hypothetical protein
MIPAHPAFAKTIQRDVLNKSSDSANLPLTLLTPICAFIYSYTPTELEKYKDLIRKS